MRRIALFILTILLFPLNNKAQESYNLDVSTGFMLFNFINDPNDVMSRYRGYGVQNNLTFWYNDKINKNLDFKIGAGYSNFAYLDFVVDEPSSYLGLKTGLDYNISDKTKLSTSLSNYVLLHQEAQDFQKLQRRFFTNLDIGIERKVGEKFSWYVSTPITLRYMYGTNPFARYLFNGSQFIAFDTDVELIGLNLGINYTIGNSKKDRLPKLNFSNQENSLDVEVGSGFLFFDLINNSEDVLNFFQGQAIQTNVNFWFNKKIQDKITARFGLGYTNFNYLDYDRMLVDHSSFFNFKFGTYLQTGWKPMQFSFAFSNYLLLDWELQDDFEYQQRLFTNIDIGGNFNLTDKFSLSVTTPLTLFPMLKGERWAYVLQGQTLIFDNNFVGMTGFNLGLSYRIN